MATGSSATNYLSDLLINWLKGSAFASAPSTLYLGLYTATPTDAGGGTEAAYSGYARQAVALGSITHLSPGSQVANTGTINFAGPAAGGVYTAFGFFDALTVGNLLLWATFTTPLSVAASQPIYFAVGDLVYVND